MTAKMRASILLFDIDGTLLSIGGAGRRAMERAFESICGSKDACPTSSFGGRTDKGIVGEGLKSAGIQISEDTLSLFFDAYHGFLREEIPLGPKPTALPGGQALLEVVSKYEHTAVGLGTGNTREGAYIKLESLGLGHYFSFGGFGCDHANRSEIIKMGIKRGAATLGLESGEVRAVVIGDTPKDISAAKDAGASSIAVATGQYSMEELSQYSPTHVFPDLTAPGVLQGIFPGNPMR